MLSHKRKTILLNIIANPFIIALPVVFLVIFFLLNKTSKYTIQLSKKQVADKQNSIVNFFDLNDDGIDEQIIAFHNIVKGEASIKVLTTDNINYEAWNFHGYFQKVSNNVYCTDINNDGYGEVFIFYYYKDSVFLSVIQPYPNKKVLVDGKFITTVWKRNGKIDYSIFNIKKTDLNKDGQDDLIFIFKAGFSRQPRMIFAYDFANDSLYHSPSYGIAFSNSVVQDLDNNYLPEIYCGSSTTGNISDTIKNILYNDYNSWLAGFDHKLNPVLTPVENSAYPSGVKVYKYNHNGKRFLIALFLQNNTKQCEIRFYQAGLKLYSKKTIHYQKPSAFYTIMVPVNIYNDDLILAFSQDGYFVLIDEYFNETKIKLNDKKAIFDLGIITIEDLNKDGKKEYVFKSISGNYLYIIDDKLKSSAIYNLNSSPYALSQYNYGIKHNGDKPSEIYLKDKDYLYFFTYNFNTHYYLIYPVWLLIYGLVVLVLWFTQRMQKINLKRKQQIEETINSLQMRTIKSQMDPHFMFNVLNGLAHNVATGNSEEAYKQILRFSQLLRSLMKRTDKIDISLEEELAFVTSYLDLEKFRFKEDFEFEVSVANDINKTIRLPRMLIQLLVENSIKHGLRNKEGLKKLKVRVFSENSHTKIVVEDNGVGRKEAMKKTRDTGKGLKLIKDLIRLNRKLRGSEITFHYTDLYDEIGSSAGTKVEVVLVNEAGESV